MTWDLHCLPRCCAWPTARPVESTENNPVFRCLSCSLPCSGFMAEAHEIFSRATWHCLLGVQEGTLLEWSLCGCKCVYLSMSVCMFVCACETCFDVGYHRIHLSKCQFIPERENQSTLTIRWGREEGAPLGVWEDLGNKRNVLCFIYLNLLNCTLYSLAATCYVKWNLSIKLAFILLF